MEVEVELVKTENFFLTPRSFPSVYLAILFHFFLLPNSPNKFARRKVVAQFFLYCSRCVTSPTDYIPFVTFHKSIYQLKVYFTSHHSFFGKWMALLWPRAHILYYLTCTTGITRNSSLPSEFSAISQDIFQLRRPTKRPTKRTKNLSLLVTLLLIWAFSGDFISSFAPLLLWLNRPPTEQQIYLSSSSG